MCCNKVNLEMRVNDLRMRGVTLGRAIAPIELAIQNQNDPFWLAADAIEFVEARQCFGSVPSRLAGSSGTIQPNQRRLSLPRRDEVDSKTVPSRLPSVP
jgi:hypothetical protein